MVSPHRLDEPAPPEPGVAGDERQPLGARGGGDDPVGGVPREVGRPVRREERDGWRGLLDDHAAPVDQRPEPRLLRPLREQATGGDQQRRLPQRNRRDREPARADRVRDRRRRRRREPPGLEAEPEPCVRIEEDHRIALRDRARLAFLGDVRNRAAQRSRNASHFSSGGRSGDFTSPMIVAVPAMQPNTSRLGSSGGTSLATGLPFLVMTTGVRNFLTSSITRRHRALNSPAGIVVMVSSMSPWSVYYDHSWAVSTGLRQ